MLSVVSWKWKPSPGYRSTFTGEHVNVLASMVARNYRHPHRFILMTDDTTGVDLNRVEVFPLWNDFANLPSPHGQGNPSCYRRLRMFSKEAGDLFGKRFVSLDLDCVLTSNMAPLWNGPEDFAIWGDTNQTTPYNGSMMVMNAGARSQVWTQFDPIKSPALARKLGYFGSDQAWIGACLGPHERKWTAVDGVYSFRNQISRSNSTKLPANTRAVFFHGRVDPWTFGVAQKYPWVREHWR